MSYYEFKDDKELKVSDWSQKWKLTIYGLAILGMAMWIYAVLMPWMNEVIVQLKQISFNQNFL